MARRTVETRFIAADELTPALAKMARAAQVTDQQLAKTSKTSANFGTGASQSAARLDALTKRFDASAAAADQASKKYEAVGKAGQAVALGAAVASAGIVGMAKKYADFDKAMSSVSAATMASASDLNRLRDAAIKLGGDTQFSAREAAQGITEMAKAGVQTQDILQGGLRGALSLAAAGQMEVAEAAETASAAMVQFKLRGDDLGHVADLLAAGAGKALGSVHDLGMALNQTGLVAASTGLSIEETVAGLSAFASAGMTGSDAGTSFKTMLQRLTPQSKEAAAMMEQLGIKAYDSQGNFVGLAEFAGNLSQSMRGLSNEQRQAAMSTIFGADAVRAATTLYEQGEQGIRKWTAAVNDQGYAARQAAKLTDNLYGDWERLTGAFDSVVMKSGSGVNDVLRGMAQSGETALEAIGKIPAPLLQAGAAFTALGVAAAGGLGVIGAVVPKIMAGKAAIDALGISAGRTGALIGMLGKSAAVVSVAALAGSMHEWIGSSSVASQETSKLVTSLRELGSGTGGAAAFLDLFATKGMFATRSVTDTGEALRQFGENAAFATRDTNAFGAVIDSAFRGKSEAVGTFTERVKQIDTALAELHASGNAEAAKQAMDQLMRSVAEQGGNVEAVRANFELYNQALATNSTEQQKAKDAAIATAAAAAGMTAEEYKLQQSLEAAQRATENFRNAVGSLGSTLLEARASARGFQEAIDAADAAVRENGRTLDIHTEKGRANQAALDGIAAAGVKSAQAILEESGSIQEAAAQVSATRKEFVEAAVRMGMPRVAAEKLADKVGLSTSKVTELAAAFSQLPTTIKTTVSADVSQALEAVRRVSVAMSALPGMGMVGVALSGAGFATGGPVLGAGTRTSDSILARLSNGEHVLTADDVDALGGHAEVERWRTLARLGRLPKFATGGPVTLNGKSTPAQVRVTGSGMVVPVTFEASSQLVSLLSGLDFMPKVEGTAAKALEGVGRLQSVLSDFIEKYGAASQQMASDASRSAAKAVSSSVSSSSVKYSGALGSAKAKPYLSQILAMGAKYDVAPELIAAVINQESVFNPNAGSPVGARGLMQLMPKTFAGLGVRGSITDPNANIEAGTKYLAQQLAAFNGSIVKALQAYNAGPGAARSGAAAGFRETQNYVKRITADTGVRSLAGGARYSSSASNGIQAAAGVMSSGLAEQMIAAAKQAVGSMYRYGGGHGDNTKATLGKTLVDCSGLINVALSKTTRKNVSEVSDTLLKGRNAQQMSVAEALRTRGAYVGRSGSGKSGHIAISMGDGTILEAPRTGQAVRIRKTSAKEWNAAAWDQRLGARSADAKAGVAAVTAAATDAVDALAQVRDELAKSLGELGLTLSASQVASLTPDKVLGLARLLDASRPVLTELGQAYDAASEKAKDASEGLKALQNEHAQFVDSMTAKSIATGSLASLFKIEADGVATSVQSIIDSRRKAIDEAREFGVEIQALKSAGLNDDDLRDVVNMGASSGLIFAKGLKDAGPAAISELNNLQTSLKVESEHLAMVSGDALYAASEAASERLLQGFLANEGKAQAALTDYGRRLTGYIQAGIGGASVPSSVPKFAPAQQKSVTVAPTPVTTVVQLDGREIARYTSATVVQAFNREAVAVAKARVLR